MKFRTKIIIIFSTISIALVGVTARAAYLFVKKIYMEQLKEQIGLLGSLAAKELDLRFLDYIEPAPDNMARLFYQERLRQLTRDMRFEEMFLFDSSGTVLTAADATLSAAAGVQTNFPQLRQLTAGRNFISVPFQAENGNWYLWAYHRLNDRWYLGLREQAQRLAHLNTLAGWFLGIALAGMLLVALAAVWLAHTIAAPVERLADYSAQIGQGRFDAQAPQKIQGELAALRDALVTMQTDLAVHQQEKERMLAQIAHELRNPLGGIELLAGLVKERLDKEDANYGYIQKIIQEIQGLKAQITAFLNFSRPLQAHPQEVDLSTVLQEIRGALAPQIDQKRARWQTDIAVGRVLFDARHLRQIIENLADNSLQAIADGGLVSIRSYEQNGSVFIEVSDDGPGVPPPDMEKIFEPFVSGHKEGTGLGLAVCRKLCAENNAQISVRNDQTKGCTFRVRITT